MSEYHAFAIPKHDYHLFLSTGGNPKFLRWWWVGVLPLSRLPFGFRIEHRNPCLIRCDNWWKEALFLSLSCDNIAWHTATLEALFSSVTIRGAHLAETFRILRSSCKMLSTDPRDMPALAAICLTVKRRSSITICSTHAIMSSDRLVRGRGSFGLLSHDVRPSLNSRTHERTFFTSITPSLHVSLNSWWILMGFMPRKWKNRIITRCSLDVNIAISVSKTLLRLDHVTSIQRVGQCCHLASPNLNNSRIFSNNFHVSICFHSWEKN